MAPRRLMAGSRQMVLDLGLDPSFDVDDFLVAPSNAEAFDVVDRWPDWHPPGLLLVGPPGSGKTHLATIWARRAGAHIATHAELDDPLRLATYPSLLLDDIEPLRCAESALFHLINLKREQGGPLVMTARLAPDQWSLRTPDLLSRLRLWPIAALTAPDLTLVRAVIVKLFQDRQIHIDKEIVAYAALHLDRSLDCVRRFVQSVDDAALAAGRKITRSLAAATIAAMSEDDG